MPKYSCAECGEDFEDQYELAAHIKEAHPNTTLEDFQCSVCQESFENKEDLAEHVRLEHPQEDENTI